jgi:hypothetical protein
VSFNFDLLTCGSGLQRLSNDWEIFKAVHWERRRLAGKAFKINAAVILHSCRRDAGAPSGQSLDSLFSPHAHDMGYYPPIMWGCPSGHSCPEGTSVRMRICTSLSSNNAESCWRDKWNWTGIGVGSKNALRSESTSRSSSKIVQQLRNSGLHPAVFGKKLIFATPESRSPFPWLLPVRIQSLRLAEVLAACGGALAALAYIYVLLNHKPVFF